MSAGLPARAESAGAECPVVSPVERGRAGQAARSSLCCFSARRGLFVLSPFTAGARRPQVPHCCWVRPAGAALRALGALPLHLLPFTLCPALRAAGALGVPSWLPEGLGQLTDVMRGSWCPARGGHRFWTEELLNARLLCACIDLGHP